MTRAALAPGILTALFAISQVANAGTVLLDSGLTGPGQYNVTVDDFGSFGNQISQQQRDNYLPASSPSGIDIPTYAAGAFMFVTTPGNVTTAIALTNSSKFWQFVDSISGDGIVGAHTNLVRSVTQPIAGGPTNATSAFRIADAPSTLQLDVGLDQRVDTSQAPTILLEQAYTITNTGGVTTDVVFHVVWELDLYYETNSYTDDIVGAGPGLCYVYMHQPGSATQAMALRSGSGTTTASPFYIAAKASDLPGGVAPAFAPFSAPNAEQHVWNNRGMPTSWRNYATTAGYNSAGESTGLNADGAIAQEYRMSLAAGASATIVVERWYGTLALPCGGGAMCGNGIIDSGETCDSMGSDTASCNATNCTASMCGDGVLNVAAGEQCESIGLDTATCNGSTCLAPRCGDGYLNGAAGEACDDGPDSPTCAPMICQPSTCGDGVVNLAAGEQCEQGALCDVATCSYTYRLGGGGAGCRVADHGSAWWLLVPSAACIALRARRRRRRNDPRRTSR